MESNNDGNYGKGIRVSADEIGAYHRETARGGFKPHDDLEWANLAVFLLTEELRKERARADEAEARAEKAKAKAKKAKARADDAEVRADDAEVRADDAEDILDMIRMALDNDANKRR